jgi:hypothetical protein
MTSTVLDVTVLLLCVSASVVALGASDPSGHGGPTATDVADRLVTETATVAYPDADAPNETRRVHATRAELLALVVARDAATAFDRRAVGVVRDGLGPRTRVDATVAVDEPTRPSDGNGFADDEGVRGSADAMAVRDEAAADPGGAVAVGPEPPRSADVVVAVVRQPIPDRFDGPSDGHRSSAGVVRIVVRRW